jgi:1,4-dihydroxy-2-naphthoate octaprenyltransferase
MASFRFFVYSNIFIAICAVLMVTQSYHLLLHMDPDPYVLLFVFFATICSYSFHWYLSSDSAPGSPRSNWQQRNQFIHVALFFIGAIGSAVLFFMLSKHWFWLCLSAIPTFLYTAPKIPHKYFRALRKIALGKTIFLSMVWMYVTTILPVAVTETPWRVDIFLFVISRFFLIYAICILFDRRDRAEDKAKGIRSLITYLDEKGIKTLFIFSLLVFGISTACLSFYHYGPLVIFLLLIPGIITAFLYNYSLRNESDVLYYFSLDGLMALSSLLTLLMWI